MKFQMPRPSGGLGRTKNILHFVQGFIIFIAWALTIAIWTKSGGIDGRTGWYWGLVSDAREKLGNPWVWLTRIAVLVEYPGPGLPSRSADVATSPSLRKCLRLC